MKELSPYIKTRYEQGGMNETLSRAMASNELTGAKDKINSLTDALTFNVRYGDMFALCFGGKPYVDYLIKEKGYTRAQAQEAFEKATVRSQQADLPSTLAAIQMEDKNLFARAFWAFRNQQMQYARKLGDAYIDYRNETLSASDFSKRVFIYGVLNPAIYEMLSLGYLAYDAKKRKEDIINLAEAPLTQLAGAVPFGDDLSELLINNLHSLWTEGKFTASKGYDLAGFEDMMRTFNKFVSNYNSDDATLNDWLNVIAEMGQFTGLNTKTFKSQLGGLIDLFKGKVVKGGMQILGYTENRANKVTGEEPEKKHKRHNLD
jgi:hypothetical protein